MSKQKECRCVWSFDAVHWFEGDDVSCATAHTALIIPVIFNMRNFFLVIALR
jgi:hypothetical protein